MGYQYSCETIYDLLTDLNSLSIEKEIEDLHDQKFGKNFWIRDESEIKYHFYEYL